MNYGVAETRYRIQILFHLKKQDETAYFLARIYFDQIHQ